MQTQALGPRCSDPSVQIEYLKIKCANSSHWPFLVRSEAQYCRIDSFYLCGIKCIFIKQYKSITVYLHTLCMKCIFCIFPQN